MFDKDLFLILCEKYNVELSSNAKEPMIRDAEGVHTITSKNIDHIFKSYQTLFEFLDA